MEATHPLSGTARPTPHPLLLAAAASVTVFSLAGIAALAGWLPGPGGQRANASPPATSMADPAFAAAPAPISVQQSVTLPPEKPVAKAAERAPAAPRRVAANAAAPSPRSAPVFAVSPAPTYPAVVPAPAYPVAATPAICRDCGVVQAVHEVAVEPKGSGGGAVAGGIVGGILGNQIGKGATRDIATVLGAVGGAYAGNHIEKSTKDSRRYDVIVRFEDGSTRTFSSETAPAWHSGDRVRLQNGALIFDGGRSGASGSGAA